MTKRGGKADGLMDKITTGVLASIQETKQAGVHLLTYIGKDIDEDIGDDYYCCNKRQCT